MWTILSKRYVLGRRDYSSAYLHVIRFGVTTVDLDLDKLGEVSCLSLRFVVYNILSMCIG